MYGYITSNNIVGELFAEMPPEGKYHFDFMAAIIELPEGVTSCWQYVDGSFLPPAPPVEPEPTITDLANALTEGVNEIV